MSNAYDTNIGAWDKVSIAFGYQDFPTGTNEEEALNAIIQNSLKSGLTFLSDQDARPRGGSHPYAHLWDNGSDVADELNRVLDIRSVALKNFGEKNIRTGYPMALLEEALVPMYFFHRYQTEATSKLIGGLNYRYALRGDGQPITEMISLVEQQKALDALLKTISPSNLMLPENVLTSIPPRPLGYDRHREVIKIRTELTFDALAIAETASELTFSLLLHPARAGRLVEYHARNSKQPSLESIIDKVTQATFKALPKSGYEGAIQITVNEVLLSNVIKLATNANASSQVKGVAYLKLDQLKSWLTAKRKAATDEAWNAHYTYALSQIENFQENPLEYHEAPSLNAPPGQPIGADEKDFCGSN